MRLTWLTKNQESDEKAVCEPSSSNNEFLSGVRKNLESIKTFYKPEDHNVAYLTLHQEPMVNGLNTGVDGDNH